MANAQPNPHAARASVPVEDELAEARARIHALEELLTVSEQSFLESATRLEEANARLAREIRERQMNEETQQVIYRLVHVAITDVPIEALLLQLLREMPSISWFKMEDKGAVFLLAPDGRTLELKAQFNLAAPLQSLCARVPLGQCLCGRAAASREILFVDRMDDRHENRFAGIADHGHYCAPVLTAKHELLGVICLYVEAGHVPNARETAFLRLVSNVLAGVIVRKHAEESLKKNILALAEINQRLQANQAQLVQSEKMASLGQLAAGVAHEINNPVGFVRSNLGTLTDYVRTFKELFGLLDALIAAIRAGRGTEQQAIIAQIEAVRSREDLAFILEDVAHLLTESLDGADRVKDIVQNLKTFARLDESTVKDADLNECIEATLKIIWNELKYKCTVHRQFGPLPMIRCYPGQLNQVFLNLLVNAAQAIPEKGDITIQTETAGPDILIRISDTGKGIPPENMPKLFTPFFTTKPTGKGTGLGLSISYGIVKKHNGDIQVASRVGQGTTFTIRLPLEGIGD